MMLVPPASALAVNQKTFLLEGGKAQLVVDNRTSGTLYVTLSGPKAYWFNTGKNGKATFKDIDPGKYTITVTSSACTGALTYEKNMKGTVTLKGFKCVAQRLGLIDQKVAKLTVDNRTGGTLYISLQGPTTYYFTASKQGKNTFNDILPGKYKGTVTSSSCGGSISFSISMNGNTTLPPYICR
jgi:uncharacterized surface anchored protein